MHVIYVISIWVKKSAKGLILYPSSLIPYPLIPYTLYLLPYLLYPIAYPLFLTPFHISHIQIPYPLSLIFYPLSLGSKRSYRIFRILDQAKCEFLCLIVTKQVFELLTQPTNLQQFNKNNNKETIQWDWTLVNFKKALHWRLNEEIGKL